MSTLVDRSMIVTMLKAGICDRDGELCERAKGVIESLYSGVIPIADYVPTPGYIEFPDGCYTGTLEGEPGWTNGIVMFAGPPPPKTNGVKDFDRALRNSKKATRIYPLVVARFGDGSGLIVYFSDGKSAINADYYDAALHRCSAVANPEFYGDANTKQVLVRSGGKLLALIACLMPEEWADEIVAFLPRKEVSV